MKKLSVKNLLVILLSAVINVWVWQEKSPAGTAFFSAAYTFMPGAGKMLLMAATIAGMAYALPISAFIKYAGLIVTVAAMATVLEKTVKIKDALPVMYGLMMLSMMTSGVGYILAFGVPVRQYLAQEGLTLLEEYGMATVVFWLTAGVLSLSKVQHLLKGRMNGRRKKVRRSKETSLVTRNQLYAFSESFKKLSESFQQDTDIRTRLNEQEMHDIFDAVTEQVCKDCSRCQYCWENVFEDSCQTAYEILAGCESKAMLQKKDLPERFRQRCVRPDNFLAEARRMIDLARTNLSWQNRLAESRLAVAGQFGEVADVIGNFSRQIADEPVRQGTPEKQVLRKLQNRKISVRRVAAAEKPNGRQSVYIDARVQKNDERPVQQAADVISRVYGRRYLPTAETPPVIDRRWQNYAFEEDVHYRTIIGDARMIRMGEMVSGDSFTVMHMDSGQVVLSLSDGMGSGEKAEKESNRMISLLEQLLSTGFNRQAALRLIHSVILAGGQPHMYSTLDMGAIDLFNGQCELIKMGAAASFVKNGDNVTQIDSTSLPPGVLQEPSAETQIITMQHGDMLVMLSDGILNALGEGDNEALMAAFLKENTAVSPQELANAILNYAMAYSHYQAEDDMTVLVCGLYRKG